MMLPEGDFDFIPSPPFAKREERGCCVNIPHPKPSPTGEGIAAVVRRKVLRRVEVF
jgi:hypothetical protein